MGRAGYTKVFYASGSQPWRQNARADGKGGLLAKGWYYMPLYSGSFGPFSSERKARVAAGLEA